MSSLQTSSSWISKNVIDWTCDEVQEWIASTDLPPRNTKQIIQTIRKQKTCGRDIYATNTNSFPGVNNRYGTHLYKALQTVKEENDDILPAKFKRVHKKRGVLQANLPKSARDDGIEILNRNIAKLEHIQNKTDKTTAKDLKNVTTQLKEITKSGNKATDGYKTKLKPISRRLDERSIVKCIGEVIIRPTKAATDADEMGSGTGTAFRKLNHGYIAILTCAHNVIDDDNEPYYKIWFDPDPSSDELTAMNCVAWYYPNDRYEMKYDANELHSEYDMAILICKDKNNWFESIDLNNEIHVAYSNDKIIACEIFGYPTKWNTDEFHGQMYGMAGHADVNDQNNKYIHDIETWPGSTGSPIFAPIRFNLYGVNKVRFNLYGIDISTDRFEHDEKIGVKFDANKKEWICYIIEGVNRMILREYEPYYASSTKIKPKQIAKNIKKALRAWEPTASSTEVDAFLWCLGCGEYVKTFRLEKFKTMDQLQQLTNDNLKELGVAMAHRNKITNGIQEHFAKNEAVNEVIRHKEDDDEKKIQNDVTSNTEAPIVVLDLLSIGIVIGEYDAADIDDIPDVCCDVANYHDVLGKEYKYKFMSSVDMKGNRGYRMTKRDVEEYIDTECLPELIGGSGFKPKAKYDGLLVAFSGHGTLTSFVCSDNKKIAYSTIRKKFESHAVLRQIPRFYCVDACRIDDLEPKETTEEKKDPEYDDDSGKVSRGDDGDAPSVTIMGQTEGNRVKGGKVSKYLCKQWKAEFEAKKHNPKRIYKPFSELYRAAYKEMMDKTSQKLTYSEYDIRIDDVVFVPKDRDRSTLKSDETAQIRDNDLRTILQASVNSKMDLMAYFFVLFNAKYQDNKALCGLCDRKLKELGMAKKFHRDELMKRVRNLPGFKSQ
eukprot:891419_1